MPQRPLPIERVALAALAVLCLVVAVGCGKSGPDASEPSAAAASGGATYTNAPADVPAKEWDQERMTQLTAELSKAMREVRNSFRNDPVLRAPDSMMQRSANQMMDILRELDQNCRALASEVERGRGADETRGQVRRIGMLLRDANVTGRSLMTTEWTDEKIKPAMELVNEIAPYYGRGPVYDVDKMEMLDAGPNPNRRREGE